MLTLLLFLALTQPSQLEESYRAHVRFLASDELEGRETGQRGQKLAAAYIASQLAASGVQGPYKDVAYPYAQTFQLETLVLKPASLSVEGAGPQATWVYGKDYALYSRGTALKDMSQELVFVGYGISGPSYSDYQPKDVAGKWALIMGGEPKVGKKKLPEEATSVWNRAAALRKAGVIGIVMIQDKETLELAEEETEMELVGDPDTEPFRAMVRFHPAARASLLGNYAEQVEKALNKIRKKGKASPFVLSNRKLTLKMDKTTGTVQTENVVGIVPGTDPVLKNQYVVISAHYDHEGIKNGEVYNGADDNASGTTTLLLAADALAKKPLKRSVILLFLSAEEKGLLGSKHFVRDPVVPLAQIVADVNVDMIGRSEDGRMGIIPATKDQTTLEDVAEQVNREGQMGMTFRYDLDEYHTRSDHYSFTKKGVPALFFFTGIHEDYHEPTDDWDKLQYDQMAKFYSFFEAMVRRVGDNPEKPKFKTPTATEPEAQGHH